MKIKMKINVTGTFHNIAGGVQKGDVVEVDDENAIRYCKLGYAEPVEDRHEERAVVNEQVEERKKADPAPEPEKPAPTQASEPEVPAVEETKTEFPKPQAAPRRPNRPGGKSE